MSVGGPHILTLRTREKFIIFLSIERFGNDKHRLTLFPGKVVFMRENEIEAKLVDAVKAAGGVGCDSTGKSEGTAK